MALIGVITQAAHQVIRRFAGAERPDRDCLCSRLPGGGLFLGGGDQDLARWPGRPQAVQGRGLAQVVEHYHPPAGGLVQPADQPPCYQSGRAGRTDAHRRRGLYVSRQHRGAAAGIDPGQQIHLAAAPQMPIQAGSKLRLAARPAPRRPVLDVGQHDHGPRNQRLGQARRTFGPGDEPVGQRRHRAGASRPHPRLC